MKRKLVNAMLIIGLCFLTACGGSETAVSDESVETTETVETVVEEKVEESVEEENIEIVYMISKSTTTMPDSEGDYVYGVEYEYDENRNIIVENWFDNKYGNSRYEREYDENGNEIRYVYKKGDECLKEVQKEYDENGRLIKELLSDLEMDSTLKTLYEYDENGILRKEIGYDGNDTEISVVEYNEKGDETRSYNDLGGGYYLESTNEYEYDANNNIVKNISYNKGALFNIKEYEYDENGNVIKETVYDDSENISYIEVIEYDENGNWIKRVRNDKDGNVISTEVATYDENGNLTLTDLQGTYGYTVSHEYITMEIPTEE